MVRVGVSDAHPYLSFELNQLRSFCVLLASLAGEAIGVDPSNFLKWRTWFQALLLHGSANNISFLK